MLTRVLHENVVHIRTGILKEFVVRVEDDDGDFAVAQDAQLVRLLHHAKLPLVERNLKKKGVSFKLMYY